MNRPGTLLCALLLAAPCSHAWLGIKRPAAAAPRADSAKPASSPAAAAPAHAPAAASAAKAADTVRLDRQVQSIPAGSPGRFLGTLEGVRCFNCAPDRVLLNLGDSVSTEAAVLAMHIDVWNAIERPLKDRRLYDYANRCFYFGYKEKDTAFVGGEWTEIRVQELPCYPYVQRTLSAHPIAADPAAAPAGVPAPVPADPAGVASAPAEAPAPATAKAVPPSAPAAPAPVRVPRPAPAAVPMDVVLEPADD